MKQKLLALVLSAVLLFSVAACDKTNPNPTAQPDVTGVATAQSTAAQSPTAQSATACITPTLSVTATPGITQVPTTSKPLTDSQKFAKITDKMFDAVMHDNYLSLYMTLHDRSKYADVSKDFGKIMLEDYEDYYTMLQEVQTQLKGINYNKLTDSEQISYLSIKQELELEQAHKKYYYYDNLVNSLTGIQSELPLVLSLMEFDSKDDVEEYIALLGSYQDCFTEVVAYEKKRASLGLIASDANLQKVIDSCKEIAADKEDHFLISTFDERIDAVKGLTTAQKTAYKANNLKVVQKVVLPAYDYLSAELTKLKGKCKNNAGVCKFTDGKKYYELLFKEESSTDMTVNQAIALLDQSIADKYNYIVECYQADNTLFDKMGNINLSKGSAQANLDFVKQVISKDYPAMPAHTVTITNVPTALENSFSPAAYISSPIDNYKNNHIVVNQKSMANYTDKIALMGHEGYPGHLYQNLFTVTGDIDNYRKTATYKGFSEGWAQLSEEYVCFKMGYDKKLMQTYLNDTKVWNELLPARIDIGVNYEGWTLAQVEAYVNQYYGDQTDYCKSVYDFVIEVPGYYMKYSIGYLELSDLVDEVRTTLGSKFVYKDCMAEIMHIANAPVNIVVKKVREWAATVKAAA